MRSQQPSRSGMQKGPFYRYTPSSGVVRALRLGSRRPRLVVRTRLGGLFPRCRVLVFLRLAVADTRRREVLGTLRKCLDIELAEPLVVFHRTDSTHILEHLDEDHNLGIREVHAVRRIVGDARGNQGDERVARQRSVRADAGLNTVLR